MWECEFTDWLSVLPPTLATVSVEPVLPGPDDSPTAPLRWTQVRQRVRIVSTTKFSRQRFT